MAFSNSEYDMGQVAQYNSEDELFLELAEEYDNTEYVDVSGSNSDDSSEIEFSEMYLNDFYETNSMGGYGADFTYVDGQWQVTYDGGVLDEVVVRLGQTGGGYGATEAMSLMLGSMGLASDHAAAAAAILKLETNGFAIASNTFGLVSAGMNIVDYYQNGDAQDAIQATLGLLLVFGGFSGGVVLVGGTLLAAWEIYELVTEAP